MNRIVLTVFLVALASAPSIAQNTTTEKQKPVVKDTTTVDLLGELNQQNPEQPQLLPDKILFTQRIFWGPNGLMRNFNAFELTPENRQKELKVRRAMLVTHQVLGFATLGGMIAQGFIGAKLYNASGSEYESIKNTHKMMATAIEIGYFSTAALSLFAPPKILDERKGYSSIKLHRYLGMIHFTGMITTMVLAGQLESHPDLKPYHRAAAYTTFGAYAASMIVIKF